MQRVSSVSKPETLPFGTTPAYHFLHPLLRCQVVNLELTVLPVLALSCHRLLHHNWNFSSQ